MMEILHLDNRIAVCVKPAGVLSTDEPGGMPQLLREQLGDTQACVRTVHRLDRMVGGLMVMARSVKAASLLSQQIREGDFQKEYLAVVQGVPPEQEGQMQDLLWRNREERKSYVVAEPGPNVQMAELEYRVLAENGTESLVHIRLHTGRTHQIRCQFASRGMPLLGDRKYGTPQEHSIALWSCLLRFTHPQTGERMLFFHLPPDAEPWNRFTDQLSREQVSAIRNH